MTSKYSIGQRIEQYRKIKDFLFYAYPGAKSQVDAYYYDCRIAFYNALSEPLAITFPELYKYFPSERLPIPKIKDAFDVLTVALYKAIDDCKFSIDI